MSLQSQLNSSYNTYYNSAIVLASYMSNAEFFVTKIQEEHEMYVTKLSAISSGEPDPIVHPPHIELVEVYLEDSDFDNLFETMKNAKMHSSNYPSLIFQMAHIYLMALFDAYLSNTFEIILKNKPLMLKSTKKQITYEKALELSSQENLVGYLAKIEINEIGYKSIKDQSEYYRDRFGVLISDSGVQIDVLTEYRARRNLLVHNNGIVNHIYTELVHETNYRIGDSVSTDSIYFQSALKDINRICLFLRDFLVEKYAK